MRGHSLFGDFVGATSILSLFALPGAACHSGGDFGSGTGGGDVSGPVGSSGASSSGGLDAGDDGGKCQQKCVPFQETSGVCKCFTTGSESGHCSADGCELICDFCPPADAGQGGSGGGGNESGGGGAGGMGLGGSGGGTAGGR